MLLGPFPGHDSSFSPDVGPFEKLDDRASQGPRITFGDKGRALTWCEDFWQATAVSRDDRDARRESLLRCDGMPFRFAVLSRPAWHDESLCDTQLTGDLVVRLRTAERHVVFETKRPRELFVLGRVRPITDDHEHSVRALLENTRHRSNKDVYAFTRDLTTDEKKANSLDISRGHPEEKAVQMHSWMDDLETALEPQCQDVFRNRLRTGDCVPELSEELVVHASMGR